jgi:hypothetical protein
MERGHSPSAGPARIAHEEEVMRKATFAGIVLLSVVAGAFAQPLGRDIVESGRIATISGRLTEQDDELYLVTSQGKIALHLGPAWYKDQIQFPARARGEATVEGYLDQKDMSPSRVTLGGKSYTFRDKDGQPMWRGDARNGQGRGGRKQGETSAGHR